MRADPDATGERVVALALCLLGALSWGIGDVVSRASGVTGGLSLTVWSALVVPVPLLALSLGLDGPAAVGSALAAFSWQAAVSTLYTAGLASLVGYGLFNGLLSRNPSAARPARRTSRPPGQPNRMTSPGVAPAQSPASAERPASRRATGTRNGEQET